MLGSSSTHEEEEEDPSSDLGRDQINLNPPHPPPAQSPLPPSLPPPPPPPSWRQVLISCAELISRCDFSSAHHLLSLLSDYSSPSGDSSKRLAYQFTRALRLRLDSTLSAIEIRSPNYPSAGAAGSGGNVVAAGSSSTSAGAHIINVDDPPPHDLTSMSNPAYPTIDPRPAAAAAATVAVEYYHHHHHHHHLDDSADHEQAEALRSSYLSLNQVTPFIRFCHLTANQAILEAVDGQEAVHVLDLDVMHGVQWPPLMQAIAQLRPRPPNLRITGAGRDPGLLRRTGDRLHMFAQSLGLTTFQFHPLLLDDANVVDEDPTALALYVPSVVAVFQDEALAVNCMHYLHRLLGDPPHETRDLQLFLQRIKAMNPRVVTVAEREGRHNSPVFLERFTEAFDHYATIFDSLEATLPPQSRERLALEQVWFGREITDIVAAAELGGDRRRRRRRHRHQTFDSCWDATMRTCGFSDIPLSPFNLSQAKLLLRLHYPSEGYQLQHPINHCLFLAWQNHALFSVSSWH
ncbi:hypothetical protein Dimus_014408 [Dionaea muscipula]